MSYYRTIVADFPLSYYTLDEVKSGSVDYYSQLLSSFPTYQSVKDAFTSYTDISGQPIIDYSGNNHSGSVSGMSGSKIMPLVSGGIYGTLISDETEILYQTPGIATSSYSDNPFTLELWTKLPDVSSTPVKILADSTSGIGIFWENGDVVFTVYTNSIRYKVSNSKAIHIAATYNKGSMSLYIDGNIVNSKSLNNVIFTNHDIHFSSGPSLPNKHFVIDSVAFYRYNLSQPKIASHYISGIKELDYSQVVYPDGGYLFSLNRSKIRPVFRYSYPESKSWAQFADNNVVMPPDQSYITFLNTIDSGSKTFTFIDEIYVYEYLNVTSSQLSYDDDISNILIEASIDNIVWQTCKNNSPLPFFNKNDGISNGILYLRVTLTSLDTSKDLPKLKSISLDFFSNTDFYADNSGDRIYSIKDYGLSRYNHPIISYNDYNGLKMTEGGGIVLDSVGSFRSLELIFTPTGGSNVLFSSNSKILEWDADGLINKSGISALYVNGVNHSTSTNISSFLTSNTPHHIVITLSSAATSGIKFNSNQSGTISGGDNLYSNIAIYPSVLSEADALTHYKLYTNRYSISVTDLGFEVAESSTGNDGTAYLINTNETLYSSI